MSGGGGGEGDGGRKACDWQVANGAGLVHTGGGDADVDIRRPKL